MQRESELQRREVHYSGRVQGVGFRWTVRSLAGRFAVTGYVRNLADGRVQMVMEGPPNEVEGLLDAVGREMGHYIRDTHQETRPATGKFEGFQIRF
jgi:acylphosphatase